MYLNKLDKPQIYLINLKLNKQTGNRILRLQLGYNYKEKINENQTYI